MNLLVKHIIACLLSIVYLYSIFSNSLLHHHEIDHHHELHYCDNTVNLLQNTYECHHNSHLQFDHEDCIWCENFIAQQFFFKKNKNSFFKTLFPINNPHYKEILIENKFYNLFNKSPPPLLF